MSSALLQEAVTQYRRYWKSISNITPCQFTGEWDDVTWLDYAIYEGFGPAPESSDYYLESAVFANFLIQKLGFALQEIGRDKGRIILVHGGASRFRLNILARVQDAMGRSDPQFDKMNALFDDVLIEILGRSSGRESFLSIVNDTHSAAEIAEVCNRVLEFLKQNEA